MSGVVRIPFHGTNLIAVNDNGAPQIVLRPALESLGLDFSAQIQKLNARSWATVGQRPIVAAIAREHGITPEKVPHHLYGEVNLLPRWVWELAAEGRRELGR